MKSAALVLILFATACGGSTRDDPATGGSGGSGASSGFGGNGAGGYGGGVPDDCITDPTPKPDHVFFCNDLKWNVSVPVPCATTACGLIFDVHGFSMNGKMEDRNTRLVELGQQSGYIVVNPNAVPPPPDSFWTAAEDDPKVFDFMKRVMTVFRVDPKRVHMTGFSQGGDMTWRFVCNHSDFIASAAPSAFGHSLNEKCFSKGQAPPRPMPILYVHGTKDAVIPFSNALAARDAVVGVLDMNKGKTVSSDDLHTWTRHTNAEGITLDFIQHEYTGDPSWGGHCYPGSTDPCAADGFTDCEPGQYFSFKCTQESAFVWGDEVMKFFLAHPMP